MPSFGQWQYICKVSVKQQETSPSGRSQDIAGMHCTPRALNSWPAHINTGQVWKMHAQRSYTASDRIPRWIVQLLCNSSRSKHWESLTQWWTPCHRCFAITAKTTGCKCCRQRSLISISWEKLFLFLSAKHFITAEGRKLCFLWL